MKVDKSKCIGCTQCFPFCPVQAISKKDGKAFIDQELCVECHICYYSKVCPKNALVVEDLSYPRSIRTAFSDVTKPHKNTGVLGRGTEEIKTNDVTARLKYGNISMSVELGRPGISTSFLDVQKVAQALALVGVHFEKENPVTSLMSDIHTGTFKKEVLHERVLSALIETEFKQDLLPEVLKTLKKVEPTVNTVFSVCVAAPLDPDTGKIPFAEIIKAENIPIRPNGKTNVGLGRPFKKVIRI